jgi:tRNA (guanine-N7-)-methyltransferase
LSFANGRIMDAAVMHSDTSAPPGPDHPGAFFGRRKGRPLRTGQTRLFDTLLPTVCVDLHSSAPASLAALFPDQPREVRLEIGFGGAEHLIAQAAANPDCGFIGVEPFINGMAKALAAMDARGLTNIRLHHGDAVDLLAWLPDASLAKVYLLYPDPWPKRRHWKRRFVQERTIAEIARVLRPGGRIGISDIVAEDRLTPEDRAERGSYVGCVAGALSESEYAAGLEAAGLVDVTIERTRDVADGMHSAIVKASKPAAPARAPLPLVGAAAAGRGCC